MRGTVQKISATPVIDTNIYGAGDNVGGLLTFSNAIIKYSKSAKLESVVVTDKSNQAGVLDLVFFSSNPTNSTLTNNAAMDVADADLSKIIGNVRIAAANYTVFNTNDNAVATVQTALPLFSDEDSWDIYGALVLTSGTPTYTSVSDLVVNLFIRQD